MPFQRDPRFQLVPSDDAQFGDHDEDWARPPNSPNASPYMENHVDLDGDDDDDDDDGTIPVHYGADECTGQGHREEEDDDDDEGLLALLPRRVARDPMEENFDDDDGSDGDDEGQAIVEGHCSGGDGGGPSGPSIKRELSAKEQELGPETEDEELPEGGGLGSRSTSPSLSSSSSSEEGPSAAAAAAARSPSSLSLRRSSLPQTPPPPPPPGAAAAAAVALRDLSEEKEITQGRDGYGQWPPSPPAPETGVGGGTPSATAPAAATGADSGGVGTGADAATAGASPAIAAGGITGGGGGGGGSRRTGGQEECDGCEVSAANADEDDADEDDSMSEANQRVLAAKTRTRRVGMAVITRLGKRGAAAAPQHDGSDRGVSSGGAEGEVGAAKLAEAVTATVGASEEEQQRREERPQAAQSKPVGSVGGGSGAPNGDAAGSSKKRPLSALGLLAPSGCRREAASGKRRVGEQGARVPSSLSSLSSLSDDDQPQVHGAGTSHIFSFRFVFVGPLSIRFFLLCA